jgi:hypothetical protein
MADPAISSPGVQELSIQAEILVSLLSDVLIGRPIVGRVCPAQKGLNAHEGERRITRLVGECWGGVAFPIRRVILRWSPG